MNNPVRLDLRCLVDTAVKQWSEFDTDEPINGAQLVEWFSTWRELAKIALAQSEEANGSPLADAAPDLLAALQGMIDTLDESEVIDHDFHGHDNDGTCQLCNARSALAKATGKGEV